MFLRYNLTGIFWAVLILTLSLLPSSGLPAAQPFRHFDKAVHFFLYAQLTLLNMVGFRKQYQYRRFRKQATRYAFLFSLFYGLMLEFMQRFAFSGRHVEALDVLANFSGTVFGVFIFWIIYGKTAVKA